MNNKFNKEQREGLARFSDTIAASVFIGAIVGLAGYNSIKFFEIAVMFVACPILLVFSYVLRRQK
jgi:hypothetical protein